MDPFFPCRVSFIMPRPLAPTIHQGGKSCWQHFSFDTKKTRKRGNHQLHLQSLSPKNIFILRLCSWQSSWSNHRFLMATLLVSTSLLFHQEILRLCSWQSSWSNHSFLMATLLVPTSHLFHHEILWLCSWQSSWSNHRSLMATLLVSTSLLFHQEILWLCSWQSNWSNHRFLMDTILVSTSHLFHLVTLPYRSVLPICIPMFLTE